MNNRNDWALWRQTEEKYMYPDFQHQDHFQQVRIINTENVVEHDHNHQIILKMRLINNQHKNFYHLI